MVVFVHAERKRKDGKPRSVADSIDYAEGNRLNDGEKCLYKAYENFEIGEALDRELRIKTMEATAALNPLSKDPIFHDMLSWQQDEIPTKDQIEDIIKFYLKEMNFEGCQCVYGLHQNTDNIHLHIIVNRIDPITYKAHDPGFYKIKHEYIARTIEVEQGWKVVNEGKFYKVIDNEVVKIGRDGQPTEKAIKQNAKDFERWSGEKSTIRIAQNEAVKPLWDAINGNIQSWNELHMKLAAFGFEIQKAGRGGVLVFHQNGEKIGVKLSSISQKISMSKLEKQLGAFEERPTQIKVQEQKLKPLIDNSKELQKYIEAKQDFLEKRKEIIQEYNNFTQEKKDAFKKLYEKQRQERKAIFGKKGQWKGKGAELNHKRSILATQHIAQKEDLKKYFEQKKQLLKMQRQLVKRTNFPDYKKWQEERNNPEAAWKFIYAKSYQGIIAGVNITEKKTPQAKNFLNRYSTQWNTNKKQLNFYHNNKLAFRDNGYHITVILDNKKNIKDALLLAKEKWGAVTLHGTDEFKRMAARIAVENNIKVKNPELQEVIKMMSAELKEQRQKATMVAVKAKKEVKEHINSFNEYVALLGTQHFRITCVKPNEDGTNRSFLLKNTNNEIDMHPYEIMSQWDEIEKLNTNGWNVYVTPMPEPMNKEAYILVDDLSPQSLEQMKKDGFKPSIVLESSPNNYQAIIIVEKDFLETDETAKEINKQAANKLMKELNEVYGDKNIRAAIHPHRIPGMNNNKLKRIKENNGVPPKIKIVETNIDAQRQAKNKSRTQKEREEQKIGIGTHCPLAQLRFSTYIDEARKTAKEEAARMQQIMHRIDHAGNTSTINPVTAFVLHARDIIDHHGVTDYSRLDAEVVMRLKATGYSIADIKQAVIQGSKAVRPKEKQNKQWKNYADRTAKYAASIACAEKIKKNEHRIGAWLAVEGRTKPKERTKSQER